MGGVCAGGMMKPKSEVIEQSSGYSGKLKSMRSFGKKKEDHFSYSEVNVFEKTSHSQSFDSGDLGFSISRELKPSTPARTGQSKIMRTEWWFLKESKLGREDEKKEDII